jgi:hypothetical protein
MDRVVFFLELSRTRIILLTELVLNDMREITIQSL